MIQKEKEIMKKKEEEKIRNIEKSNIMKRQKKMEEYKNK